MNKFRTTSEGFRLAASEFPTKHRAEYEIMKIALKTVKATQAHQSSANRSIVEAYAKRRLPENLEFATHRLFSKRTATAAIFSTFDLLWLDGDGFRENASQEISTSREVAK